MKLLSKLPDAKYYPSDEKSNDITSSLCPSKYLSTLLVSKLIKTILESDTAANKFVPICKVKASIHSAFNLIVC